MNKSKNLKCGCKYEIWFKELLVQTKTCKYHLEEVNQKVREEIKEEKKRNKELTK